jgi:hypothetical protein
MPLKTITVAVSSMPGMSLTEEQKSAIQAISPRIRLVNLAGLIDAERRGDAGAAKELDAGFADIEVFFGALPPP